MKKSTKTIKYPLTGRKVALDSSIKVEALPLPYVHYPDHYGTFFAFSESQSSQRFFCSCTKVPIENFLKLVKASQIDNSNPLRNAPLPNSDFPQSISHESAQLGLHNLLQYRDKICHRCNLSPPTLTYCHPMYGGNFKQTFGWYINQTKYRIGIKFPIYLADYTPLDWQIILNDYQKLQNVREALIREVNEGKINWLEVNEHDKAMSKLHRKIEKKLENITREDFGFRKVGEGNVSETILSTIVQKIYAGYEIIRHHRPKWLEGLELDIFVPDFMIAFEYQGQQHFHPISAWGGQPALEELKKRDKAKKEMCRRQKIRLIEIDYTEPLEQEYVAQKIDA